MIDRILGFDSSPVVTLQKSDGTTFDVHLDRDEPFVASEPLVIIAINGDPHYTERS